MEDYQATQRDLERFQGLHNDYGSEDGDDGGAGRERGRGRPMVPLQWSRVISISQDDLSQLRSFDLNTDLIVDSALGEKKPLHEGGGRRGAWSM